MGAVSSAFVLTTLSSVHILYFRFTDKNPKTFENYGRLRKRLNFPSTVEYNYRLLKVGYVNQVIQSLKKNLNDKQV